MPSNLNAIDGAVYEPEAKIFDIYRKTTAEFMEFQVILQMDSDQALITWTQVGYPSPFYALW